MSPNLDVKGMMVNLDFRFFEISLVVQGYRKYNGHVSFTLKCGCAKKD
jgi:hypothetical protein